MPFSWKTVYPEPLRQSEAELIGKRRAAVHDPADGVSIPPGNGSDKVEDAWGLALSGGGIRSATFCLGVLQSLARSRLLPRFDFLSTVSGGGFIGAFLGLGIQRLGAPSIYRDLGDNGSPIIRWFRDNGRYLTPNGVVDLWGAAATMLRNWFSVHVVVASTLLATFLGAQLLRALLGVTDWSLVRLIEPEIAPTPALQFLPSPWFWLAGALVVTWLAPSAWAYWLTQRAGKAMPPYVGALVTAGCALLAYETLIDAEPVRLVRAYWVLLMIAAVVASGTYLFWVGVVHRVSRKEGLPLRGLAWWAPSVGVLLWALTLVLLWRPGLWLPVGATWLGVFLVALLAGWVVLKTIDQEEQDRARRRLIRDALSGHTTAALIAIALILGAGLIDSAGQSTYQWIAVNWDVARGFWGGIAALMLNLFPVGSALVPWVHRVWGLLGSRWKPSVGVVIGVAAALLLVLYLTGLSIVAYAIRNGGSPLSDGVTSWFWLSFGLLATTLTAAIVSRLFGFVNTSSLHDFYVSRLNRAYLGAANRRRHEAERPVTQALKDDDEEYLTYQPHLKGAPLHLINVTLNETVSGHTRTEELDRRGLPLAIHPSGLTLGARWHATWEENRQKVAPVVEPGKDLKTCFHIWPETCTPESLSLGYWTGISGAAFTTGTGYRTTLGTSLLAGLFNVRLGFWWDSGVDPAKREGATPQTIWSRMGRGVAGLMPVQAALIEEFLARFHGPARRRWYLSDGGHFENTAGYELIRRRLPVILLCDCGADPTYCFEDIARLVRLARTDFGATIRFLRDRDRLYAVLKAVGTLDGLGLLQDLIPQPADGHPLPLARAHMTVAQVTYDGGESPPSLLLVLKPTLQLSVSSDLLEYHCRNTAFPQQPTTDQFFDENQWECYRQLGSEIGGRVRAVLQPEVIKALHGAFDPLS